MLTTVLATSLGIIFLFLAGCHMYWLFGGKLWLDSVIPTKEHEDTVFEIPLIATLFSALFLFVFAVVYFIKTGWIEWNYSVAFLNKIYWFLPVLFTLRAIGDFRYLGFFKKVKSTKFGQADSKVFAPLCLGIGITGFLIQLI